MKRPMAIFVGFVVGAVLGSGLCYLVFSFEIEAGGNRVTVFVFGDQLFSIFGRGFFIWVPVTVYVLLSALMGTAGAIVGARAVRWRVVAAVGLALLLLLGGWAHFRAPDDDGLSGTVWKHQKGNATITLEFSRVGYIVGNPLLKYTTAEGNATGRGSVTYTILADKTLSLASGDQITIHSKSSEKLVLSGGPWKLLDKTEFERQK